MKRPRSRLVIACAVALILHGMAARVEAGGEYRTLDVESLRITVDSDWVPATALGYVPVRWDITNLGADRTIDIQGDGTRMSTVLHRYTQSRKSVRQRIRLAAGDRVRFTMAVPTGGDSETVRFQIREDGRTIQTLGFVSTRAGLSALIVAAPNSSYGAEAPGWVRTLAGPGRRFALSPTVAGGPVVMVTPATGAAIPPTGPPQDLILEPARLPTSWLGYTSVQAVVIGLREWEQMVAAQQTAVLTWTACGGNLILVDTGLDTLFPDPQHRPTATRNVAEHFFGRIHLRPAAEIAGAGFAGTLTSIDATVFDPSWVLPLRPIATSPGAPGFRLPIPGVNAVPTGAYLTILVLFSVLIGPINYVVLKRRGQQALVVLTTPVIAAVFIVLLAGYVVIVEGFGVSGRAVSFTVLDQPRGQAATRAAVSLYAAGGAPSGGLRFARDVAVFPTPVEGAPPVGEVLDLSEIQQYPSGLLQARTPTNFETVGFRAARERLTFSRENGRLRVSNGLGSTVARMRFRRGNESYALDAPLPPGAVAWLRQETAAPAPLWLGSDDAVLARFYSVVTTLPDDSYLAVLDRSPFWDGGTPDIDERASFHLVLGRVGGEP